MKKLILVPFCLITIVRCDDFTYKVTNEKVMLKIGAGLSQYVAPSQKSYAIEAGEKILVETGKGKVLIYKNKALVATLDDEKNKRFEVPSGGPISKLVDMATDSIQIFGESKHEKRAGAGTRAGQGSDIETKIVKVKSNSPLVFMLADNNAPASEYYLNIFSNDKIVYRAESKEGFFKIRYNDLKRICEKGECQFDLYEKDEIISSGIIKL